MDKLLKDICKLLDSEDVELQCSAARVLGELSPKSGQVLLALASHLATPNLIVKNYILSALAQIPGAEALPYLFPLLREGGKVQEKASRIIAATGSAAVAEAKKLFPDADPELKKLLVRILGVIGTTDACRFLIDCIAGNGLDLSKSICLALREAMGRMSRQDKKEMLKKINALLASSRVKADVEKTASGVILIGHLADPSTVETLIRYAESDHPIPVREQALIALSHTEFPPALKGEVARAIIPMLNEDNYPNIVRHALAVLQRLEISKKLSESVAGMLTSKHPSVRSFVLSHMGAVASRENIECLLEHLNVGDFQERRAAQEALASIPKAYPHIIRALDSAKDYEAGMRLVSILRAQGAHLSAVDKRHLFEKMEKLREAGNERHSLYAGALNVAAPAFLTERISARVKRLKSSRKFGEAEELLRILLRHSLLTDDLKFELAVMRFRNNPPDLSSLRRKDDEGLNLIAELVGRESFPLLKRLKTEKAFRPDDLYTIGFHFAEKLFKQRDLGVDLLTHLVKKSPRGKVGVAARQKLALVGVNL